MLRILLASALVAVLATTSAEAAPKRHHRHRQHESALISSETATKIPGHYMVMLREDAEDLHVQDHFNWLSTFLATSAGSASTTATNKNRVKHVYDMPGLKGYAGHFDEAALRAIRAADHVAYIEQDQVVKIVDEDLGEPPHAVVQKDAPWGLSRISHRERPAAAHYKEYPHAATAGANVSVYVIDTGINIKHVDFEGRARWGATIPENDEDEDGNGHGTHCAGTISGKRYGVAKKANAVAVKVLSSNGSGSMSDVVKGVEWAVQDHKRRRAKDPKAKSAANMSLGGGSSKTLDRIVNAAVDAGIAFAVAAGNDNRNACNYSPAAAEKAVTVGATANDDTMAWFSNHGKCVDVFAPGKDVLSTWIGSNVATNTISGTSMASPHVAGLLAYHLSQTDEEIKPKALKELVIKAATKDVIKGLPKPGKPGAPKQPKWPFPWPPPGGDNGDEDEGKTPNLLIFTGIEEAPEEPVPEPPSDGGDDDDEEGLLRILPWTRDEVREVKERLSVPVVTWVHKAVRRIRIRIEGAF